MSVLKRQRELKKAEKAAKKRAKRHGVQIAGFTEPQPTLKISDLGAAVDEEEEDAGDEEAQEEPSH
ncbi:MAG: hypothetical protein GY716_22870 [bacterium]|nr:hypothetical protein [bacterium]